MLETLSDLLQVQDKDMQMLRLLRLKEERLKELRGLSVIRESLDKQLRIKKNDLLELKSGIKLREIELMEIKDKIKEAEKHQESVKKVEEFNALSQDIAQREREKNQIEHRISEENEKLSVDEEVYEKLEESLKSAEGNYQAVAAEVKEAIAVINEEGRKIKRERQALVKHVPQTVLDIYMRLLNNKRSSVVVPIENRSCSGCHILVTAQHENLARRADKLVFCEHCSRIHYLQQGSEDLQESGKKRRRRKSAVA